MLYIWKISDYFFVCVQEATRNDKDIHLKTFCTQEWQRQHHCGARSRRYIFEKFQITSLSWTLYIWKSFVPRSGKDSLTVEQEAEEPLDAVTACFDKSFYSSIRLNNNTVLIMWQVSRYLALLSIVRGENYSRPGTVPGGAFYVWNIY